MEKKFGIKGVHCGGCMASIRLELLDIDGISEVEFEEDNTVLVVRGDNVDSGVVKNTVEEIEFTITGEI